MISTRFVLLVLGGEVVAILLALGLLVGHGSWRALRERRLAPRRVGARAALVGALVEHPDEPLPLSLLDGLPLTERIDLMGTHEPAVAGHQRAALHDLAGRAGLLARAQRLCRSRRWKRRLIGARIYTLLGGGEDTVPRLFADRRPEVRAEAAVWAAEHPEPDNVDRLVALLGDETTLCRFTVKDSLLRLGAGAIALLSEFLLTARGAAAQAGLEVGAALGDPRLLDIAFRLREDPDPAIRRAAVDVLATLGGEAVVAALVDSLGDPAAEVRSAAARGLGIGHHWTAGPQLAAALRDASWDVRHEAATALRRMGAAGELLLRRMLDDEDRFARDIARLMLDLPFVPV